MNTFEDKYRNWHTKLSYMKSAVRIGGCAGVIFITHATLLPVTILAASFLAAEIIGIVEEWV
jgi:hypothetical protein